MPHYVHAALYAAEGEILFGALGEPWNEARIFAFAHRLAELQRHDGLFPAWSDGRGSRLDATAQAVRVFSNLDAHTWAGPIDRALGALARLQDRRGGLPYARESADLNTWVALFSDQATAWAEDTSEPLAWL